MRTWSVLKRLICAPWVLMKGAARGIKYTGHAVHVFCAKHQRIIHKIEHFGNAVLLTSVAAGIRELEATAAGCLVILILLITVAGDEA